MTDGQCQSLVTGFCIDDGMVK